MLCEGAVLCDVSCGVGQTQWRLMSSWRLSLQDLQLKLGRVSYATMWHDCLIINYVIDNYVIASTPSSDQANCSPFSRPSIEGLPDSW